MMAFISDRIESIVVDLRLTKYHELHVYYSFGIDQGGHLGMHDCPLGIWEQIRWANLTGCMVRICMYVVGVVHFFGVIL